jgi:hypothetical protein
MEGTGRRERALQARISNLRHYAATGVRAQVFVLDLFYRPFPVTDYLINTNMLQVLALPALSVGSVD